MEKSTKLIIAAVGLGGLGYFLYKKGLFAKTTIAEVAKDVKKDVVDVVTPKDDIKVEPSPPNRGGLLDKVKAAVEPSTKPCEVIKWNCGSNPRETIIIPYDANCNDYQYEKPPCAPPPNDDKFIKIFEPIDFRDNTYYDQPIRTDPYMGRDMINARFNQYIYA